MNYNQFLGNGKRILNTRYLGVDRIYNNFGTCNVIILEEGLPLSQEKYYDILPDFYLDGDMLPFMCIDSIIVMLKCLKKLKFVLLKKECKFFELLLNNNGFYFQ
jgi:hypothetical protein